MRSNRRPFLRVNVIGFRPSKDAVVHGWVTPIERLGRSSRGSPSARRSSRLPSRLCGQLYQPWNFSRALFDIFVWDVLYLGGVWEHIGLALCVVRPRSFLPVF